MIKLGNYLIIFSFGKPEDWLFWFNENDIKRTDLVTIGWFEKQDYPRIYHIIFGIVQIVWMRYK